MIDNILKQSFDDTDDLSFDILLQEKLKSSGLSKTQFEKFSGLQRRSLDGIINKSSKQTDIINLLKLGEFLELSFEELLVLHFRNRPQEEIKELQKSMDITYINKHFDLKTLANLGFINKNDTTEILCQRVCDFFQINSIYEYEQELNEALYSRTKRPFSDKMKEFWIKSSYKYFELINNQNEI